MSDIPFILQDLPKPPVPDLQKTLDRYLESIQPVVTAAQFEESARTVRQFLEQGGEGEALQEALERFASQSENWVTELWMEDMYLYNPIPLPVNSNPFYLLPKQSFRSTTDQLRFASKLIQFCFLFKAQIDSETLPQDIGSGHGKGVPLCMETYRHFFTACRIPGPEKDQLYLADKTNRHFTVACRDQFYSVTLGPDDLRDEETIVDTLRHIWYSSKETSSPPLGLLTTENRRTWGRVRSRLIENSLNQQSLECIESSLFVICLDDTVSAKASKGKARRDSIQMARMELSYMANHLLAGGGSEYYTGNRWFDKFLQLVVGKDGICGIVCEHCASEGITVLRFLDEFLEYIKQSPSASREEHVKLGSRTGETSSRQIVGLQWKVDDLTGLAIAEAANRVNKQVDDVDLYVLQFNEFGKQFIKSQCLSPDAFIQLALQLTYYKVHRKLVSTYESAGLRQFGKGRVDNIRAANMQSLAWVKAMCDEVPEITEDHKVDLFREAMTKQIEVLKYTISGHGPDNHLLGLLEMSKRKADNPSGLPCPLFREKAYSEYLNYKLSTSQLPNDSGILVGYGAVVPDGYGCSYNPCSNSILFCISSFHSSLETGSEFFGRSLEGSLLQLREICLRKLIP
ncbi:Choline O-acetyltransferase [Halotydeus destructor]|nr:Choline O-acetyltransferase [Halotydeus destructor]